VGEKLTIKTFRIPDINELPDEQVRRKDWGRVHALIQTCFDGMGGTLVAYYPTRKKGVYKLQRGRSGRPVVWGRK